MVSISQRSDGWFGMRGNGVLLMSRSDLVLMYWGIN